MKQSQNKEMKWNENIGCNEELYGISFSGSIKTLIPSQDLTTTKQVV